MKVYAYLALALLLAGGCMWLVNMGGVRGELQRQVAAVQALRQDRENLKNNLDSTREIVNSAKADSQKHKARADKFETALAIQTAQLPEGELPQCPLDCILRPVSALE